ncbi:HEPN domain-containing protein [Pseudomonas sp. NPDC088368]|uniref:HEPN domain-containing protein n=1 Tax=Pseudomonas sp. NPDC088368 TaxID=3364453 RepID=UPI00380E7714
MSKKNPLAAIIEKKTRADRHDYAAWGELATLHSGFSLLANPESYQISIHVVAIASCIETFCKSCIKNLIDHENSPYLERAKNFKDLSFDFELTKALSKKEITFGDLVSHSVAISSTEQIMRHFDTLLGGDDGYKNFKNCLASVREFVEPPEDFILGNIEGYDIQLGDIILDRPDDLIRDIQAIFTARHIIAHEANFRLVSKDQLYRWFESAMAFANAIYEIIEQRLRPGASRAAFGSSVQALQNSGELFSAVQEKRQDLVRKWQAEWNLDNSALEMLWLEVKASEDAFSAYLEKEICVNFRRVGMITGNGYRHLEAKIQKRLLELKLIYLEDLLAES